MERGKCEKCDRCLVRRIPGGCGKAQEVSKKGCPQFVSEFRYVMAVGTINKEGMHIKKSIS